MACTNRFSAELIPNGFVNAAFGLCRTSRRLGYNGRVEEAGMEVNQTGLATILVGCFILTLVACGGGSVFVIEDPRFASDPDCSLKPEAAEEGGGRFLITSEGEEEAQVLFENELLRGILHSYPSQTPVNELGFFFGCLGVTHTYQGTVEFNEFRFVSDAASPLEFEVAEEGYRYVAGSGTVTAPDGTETVLP
jgi:hypothetical protein